MFIGKERLGFHVVNFPTHKLWVLAAYTVVCIYVTVVFSLFRGENVTVLNVKLTSKIEGMYVLFFYRVPVFMITSYRILLVCCPQNMI